MSSERTPTPEPILLIDTNVWLDLFIPDRPKTDDSTRLLSWCMAHNVSLTYASPAIIDVFAKVSIWYKRWVRESTGLTEERAAAIKAHAWECVARMEEMANAVPIDSVDVHVACKYRDLHNDLEDDVVLSAARRARANYLVTSDRKLLAHSPLNAQEPQDMLALLQSGMAEATPIPKERDPAFWLAEWLSRYE